MSSHCLNQGYEAAPREGRGARRCGCLGRAPLPASAAEALPFCSGLGARGSATRCAQKLPGHTSPTRRLKWAKQKVAALAEDALFTSAKANCRIRPHHCSMPLRYNSRHGHILFLKKPQQTTVPCLIIILVLKAG